MALYTEEYLVSFDGKTKIHVNQWVPGDGRVKGVVQIAHGVAEYGKRYEKFAEFLCDNGYAVVANDHLGHGLSVIEDSPMVYFGEENGWWNVVDDLETVRLEMVKKYPFKPYFLFGHSMGSFLARTYLERYPGKVDGCILCGTGEQSSIVIWAGKILALIEEKRFGKTGYSSLIDHILFGSYNKKFQPNRTEFDWISANEENVDRYIEDPLCGGRTTIGLFKDMMEGLSYILKEEHLRYMNKETAVYLISGKNDPVGNMGKGVKKVYNNLKKLGMKDVKAKLYKGFRHEILNEKDNERVYKDILSWIEHHTL